MSFQIHNTLLSSLARVANDPLWNANELYGMQLDPDLDSAPEEFFIII